MASTPQQSANHPLASTSDPSTRQARITPQVLFPLILFVLSAAINLYHVDITEIHPDESRWINRADYATDLLDPFGPTWQDQYLTRGQPPLGSYLMGIGLLIQGRDTVTNGVWDFAYAAEWNRAVGASPSEADLDAARRTNAIVGAVTVVLVYFIGRSLLSAFAGVAGALMLALHPLQIWISSQALSDELLIMLIAAATLAMIRMCRRPSRGAALALGILLGLGGATKLSPLLLSFPLAMYGLVLIGLARSHFKAGSKAVRIGALLLWQPAIAIATFVVTYPYLWPAPIQRTWNLFALRSQEMDEQSAAWPNTAVENPLIAVARIYDRLTWEFSTTGDIMGTVAGWFGVDADPWGFDIPLGLIGAGILIMLCFRRGLASGTMLASLLIAGQVAAIVVGMKVDFYRYHLPVVLAVCLLTGIAAGFAWHQLAIRGTWRIWNVIPGVSVSEPGSGDTQLEDEPTPDNVKGSQPLQTGSNQ